MLLEKETLERFGYTEESLSKGSGKKIVISCDYCQVVLETTKGRRTKANEFFDKDACMKCRGKKREDICEKKYGVRNQFQRQEIKEKTKTTSLEKYGTERPMQSDQVKEKSKKTCLERYGVESAMQSQEIKDRHKQVCLDKYGVENVSSLNFVKQKRKQTNLELYGNEYYLSSKHCRDRIKQKYNVDNVFQLDWIKEKIKESNIRKYGVDHLMKSPEHHEARLIKGQKTRIERGQIKVFKSKQIKDWAKETGYSKSRFGVLVKQYGWDQAIRMTPTMSSLEVSMQNILNELGASYKSQIRVDNYVADFVIDDLIIECDGLFWHSEKHKKNNYHVKKRISYIENGFAPLFFRQDEILNKPEVVSSIIRNKLGTNNRIYARKCEIVNLTKQDAKEFLRKNHLMGNGGGDSLGLIHNGEIVSCLQLRNKGELKEISRYCNVLNTSVVGGFTRLIKNEPKLFTFIDLRYGSGSYLEEMGFEKMKFYPSFRWTDGTETFHRMKFPNNTGYENKLYKIWDCGQLRYQRS